MKELSPTKVNRQFVPQKPDCTSLKLYAPSLISVGGSQYVTNMYLYSGPAGVVPNPDPRVASNLKPAEIAQRGGEMLGPN